MIVLSLFDGISCGQVALQRANIKYDHYFASEIDKYAIQVTQKNFPYTHQIGDVTKLDWTPFIGKVNLLMGGSPCQDLSIAKKDRRGLDGSRSGLFFKFLEALQAIKPKYWLLENVASMSKENEDLITKYLGGVEPIMINSALVSAQQRKRLYWTNIPNVTQPEDKGILLKDILERGMAYSDKCESLTASYKSAVFQDSIKRHRKTMVCEPITIRSLNNIKLENEKANCLQATSWKGAQSNGMTNIPVRIGELNSSKSQANRIYSVRGKSVSLNANGGGLGAKTGLYKIDLPDGDYVVRKLTPVECERLQTLPDNYTAGISNTQRYKCLGNGWTVDVIAHILKGMKLC